MTPLQHDYMEEKGNWLFLFGANKASLCLNSVGCSRHRTIQDCGSACLYTQDAFLQRAMLTHFSLHG